ncbi:MAG: type I asparaginase [Neptunomonas phycophila]|uniref:type I asparaginase n=1 Tax=Neptunomonas phycophila TaxID=1572645 RepID=UPI003B8C2F5C
MTSKVLIIYTGGTIGMAPSDAGYKPQSHFADLVKTSLNSTAYKTLAPFDMIELDTLIDSANIQLHHWTDLAKLISDHYDDYAGFVILHGTDTMAYTASALSFMLNGLDKPVILTGSQIPLIQPRSDATNNLLNAVAFAREPRIHEVCVLFDNQLLRGNRATKVHTSALRAFDSPSCKPIGHAGIDIEYRAITALPAKPKDFIIPTLTPSVSQLVLYPGISNAVIDAALLDPTVKGVVMSSFGAGNPPDSNEHLMASLATASARGVIIVNITLCHAGEVIQGAYATGETLNALGIIAGADMTAEAAFTKLTVLLSSGMSQEAIRSQLTQSICGELSNA